MPYIKEVYPEKGNAYHTRDLKYLDVIKSNKVTNQRFEAENYNKEIESKGKDKCKNRLELRSKDLKGKSIPDEFQITWFKRWSKALKEYQRVQDDLNKYLSTQWKEIEKGIAKGKPSKFSSPYSFYEAQKGMRPNYQDGRPKKFKSHQRTHAMDLLDSGMSYTAVAEATGISRRTLIRYRKEYIAYGCI